MNYRYIIKYENGVIIEHPIDIQNMLYVNKDFSLNPLEVGYKFFERVVRPTPGQHQKVEGPVYQLIDDVVKDVWTVVDMTPEEIQQLLE